MKLSQTLLASTLAVTALSAPTATLEKRATTICGQWDSVVTGTYTVYQDLWGESAATSGSQCSTVNSDTNGKLSWSTSWSWAGGPYSVKSFANVVVNTAVKQISAIKSIPTTWDWSYTGSNIIADVAYDMFTSSSATGSNEYEIMVWLGALGGAGPISASGSAIATVTIGGISWHLFSGKNGSTTVYSFVAASETQNYTGDLLDFYKYLESSDGFSSSQYLLSLGAGTEPFTGSNAVLTVSAYQVVVN